MCRNISLPESPFALCIFKAVYVIGDFPFWLYYIKRSFRKQSAKAPKKTCWNCTKQRFPI